MGAVTLAPGINAIRAATVQIRGLVRRTLLLAAAPTREQPQAARGLLLKLEALQVTGSSFKARGAVNALLALPSSRLQRVHNRFG
jgi:threonine dehydratase